MKAKNLSLECIYHAAELQFTCIALPDKIAFFLIQRNHDFSPEFPTYVVDPPFETWEVELY